MAESAQPSAAPDSGPSADATDLAGRAAIVTGGGTGIGRACVERLSSAGVNVVINYAKSEAEAEQAMAAATQSGVRAELAQADVSDDSAVRAMVARTVQEFGRLDFLVNSAGVTRFVDEADLEGLDENDWRTIMDVNVRGAFQCVRAAAPHLRESHGAVVTVGSTAGFSGRGSSIAYAASKAAVVSLTKSLARALAPEVRVNAVAPGIVNTRWVAGRSDHVERLSATTPLRRVCEPHEVADVIFFLAASATFVTGQTVVVDGGMFL
jgi:3-oxoacyl-[acyl-carrier protein] reductase